MDNTLFSLDWKAFVRFLILLHILKNFDLFLGTTVLSKSSWLDGRSLNELVNGIFFVLENDSPTPAIIYCSCNYHYDSQALSNIVY